MTRLALAAALALVLAPAVPAQEAPQPAIAELLPYTEGLAPCLDAATDPETARACIGRFAEACMAGEEGGWSTTGMMFCTLAEAHAWDVLLNRDYQRAMETARAHDAEEAEFFPEYAARAEWLRNAQRAWIGYRDAQCGFDHAFWGAGSMRMVAGASCRLDMTADRAIWLHFVFAER